MEGLEGGFGAGVMGVGMGMGIGKGCEGGLSNVLTVYRTAVFVYWQVYAGFNVRKSAVVGASGGSLQCDQG